MVIRAKSTVPPTTLRAVVSREPDLISPVPELTARVARAAFPKGNPYLRLRDELGPVFRDGDFADLYPRRGQPALPPWKLALVTVMQFAEDLSDRQAADAVRGRIDWKYALGLELDDPGFHFSALSEFRGRLTAGGAQRLLLDEMLEACKDRGLLKARARQRTDSTHVLAATRDLNRLELVGETLRATLNALATVAPQWLRQRVPPEWFDRYAARVEETRLPKGQEARYAHAEVIGGDGYRLLEALRRDAAAAWLWQVPAVEVLRRVWLTQFYLDDGRVRWRTAADLAPAGQRINSPYDAEATFGNKRSMTWTGYKVHVSETCEPDQVHLITHVETTLGRGRGRGPDGADPHGAGGQGPAAGRPPAGRRIRGRRVAGGQPVRARGAAGGPGPPRRQLAGAGEPGLRHRAFRDRLGGAAGDLPRGQDEHPVEAGSGPLGQRGDPHRVRAPRVPGLPRAGRCARAPRRRAVR